MQVETVVGITSLAGLAILLLYSYRKTLRRKLIGGNEEVRKPYPLDAEELAALIDLRKWEEHKQPLLRLRNRRLVDPIKENRRITGFTYTRLGRRVAELAKEIKAEFKRQNRA